MNKLMQVGQLEGKHEQSNRVYSEDGVCPTIMAGERKSCTGGYVSPKIMVKENDIKLNNNRLMVVGNTVPSGHTAGRIFDIDGISPTVMYRNSKVVQILDNQGVIEDMSRLNQIGYIDKNAQGQRIYDLELSPTLKSNGGGISGASGLHIMGNNKLIHKGVDGMWNNNLEKFNFEMEEIRIFDIFAGIGALHQSLKELGVPVRVTNLSEIDIDATISYAAGHIDNFKDLEFEYPSVEEMRQWLIDRNIGYSFEKNKSSVPRMKLEKLKLAYKANVLLNNLGDISKIDYDKIEDFDLMNMSFCCFTEGTLILTDKGYKNIEDITSDDYVLTHTNNFKKVVKPMKQIASHI